VQVAEPPFAVASALAVLFILTRLAVLALDHARHYDPLPTDPDIIDPLATAPAMSRRWDKQADRGAIAASRAYAGIKGNYRSGELSREGSKGP
jgi:hypothetical protein